MVHIIQLLCGPNRHAGSALLCYGGGADNIAFLKAEVERMQAQGTMTTVCPFCGAPKSEWFYEDRPTGYATMAQAEPMYERVTAAIKASIQMLRTARN